MRQEVITGIIIAIIILFAIIISVIKKIKWAIILSVVLFVVISMKTGAIWLALDYEKLPNLIPSEIEIPTEVPEIEIELPEIPKIEYEIDHSRIGFGLDGIIDK